MQSIFPYWDVLDCKTKPNATMVKDLVIKCYVNGAAVTTIMGKGEHRMLGDLMSATLYATVPSTPFAAPTETVLTIPPTVNHLQLALYKLEHKEKLRVFLNFQHFIEELKKILIP